MKRDTMHNEFKFDTPKLDTSNCKSFMDVLTTCLRGISSNSVLHKINQAVQIEAHYIRTKLNTAITHSDSVAELSGLLVHDCL